MSDSYPLVSIITPSYNQARYLEQTIRSVLDQDYPNLEYLIVDGGSTDGSQEIIQRYAIGLPGGSLNPIRDKPMQSTRDLGKPKEMILAWLNSDDTYLPNAVVLRSQIPQFSSHAGYGLWGCPFD